MVSMTTLEFEVDSDFEDTPEPKSEPAPQLAEFEKKNEELTQKVEKLTQGLENSEKQTQELRAYLHQQQQDRQQQAQPKEVEIEIPPDPPEELWAENPTEASRMVSDQEIAKKRKQEQAERKAKTDDEKKYQYVLGQQMASQNRAVADGLDLTNEEQRNEYFGLVQKHGVKYHPGAPELVWDIMKSKYKKEEADVYNEEKKQQRLKQQAMASSTPAGGTTEKSTFTMTEQDKQYCRENGISFQAFEESAKITRGEK